MVLLHALHLFSYYTQLSLFGDFYSKYRHVIIPVLYIRVDLLILINWKL